MSTSESPMIAKLFDTIHGYEPLALNSGSIGDAAHMAETHTYHVSFQDQRHDDGYSVHYHGDKHELHADDDHPDRPDVRMFASAQDISYAPGWVLDGKHFHHGHYERLDVGDKKRAKTISSEALMVKYTARLHHLALGGGLSAWATGLREFAGTLNGNDVFSMDTTPQNGVHAHVTYGFDSSHLWHHHLSINRRLVNSPRILKIAKVWAP